MSLKELCELGVVSGADLTVEAALTKLSYLLGQPHLTVQQVRQVYTRTFYFPLQKPFLLHFQAMRQSIRGEMTINSTATNGLII